MGGLSSGSADAGDGADMGGDTGDGVDGGDGGDGDTGDASGHDGDTGYISDFGHIMSHVFGIGQMPVSLLLGIFMFCWGACGMAMNQLFSGMFKYPAVYVWPSMGATFVVSFVITRSMAAIFTRMVPREETFGVSRRELAGLVGKAVYAVSEKAGTIDICDKYGTVHRTQAKTGPGGGIIPSGSKVLVMDYDTADKKFVVKTGGF